MVTITTTYLGDLRCESTHGPSQTKLLTDAPLDNQGKGEAFSPTDLVATALSTCMLTVMGIAARHHGIALEGSSVMIEKSMVKSPTRRIGRLAVKISVPNPLTEAQQQLLTEAAMGCPVKTSLHADIDIPVEWDWA